jgi:methyl-accepting chemotaxis protein
VVFGKHVAVDVSSMTISASYQAPTQPREPAGSLPKAPRGKWVRWFTSVRTKLFASFILLASFTVIACGVSVWLFDGFSSLFSRTIRRDFATFGSMVRLQEEASQLAQLTVTLSASVHQAQLAPVLDAVAAGHDKANNAVTVLRRDADMTSRVDDIAAKVDHVFTQYKLVEEISAARIAAVERRAKLSAGVLAALDQLEDAVADRSAAAGVAEFRHAAALGAAFLSEAALVGTADLVRALRARFETEAATLERLAPTVGGGAPKINQAIEGFEALGRGSDNLFELREAELRAIATEALAIPPVREEAATLSDEFGRIVEDRRHDLDETTRISAASLESTRTFLLLAAAGSGLTCLMIALFYVGRNVAGRLRRLSAAMSALAGGNTEVEVPLAGAHDEIGEMAEALRFFKEQTVGAQRLAQEVTYSVRRVSVAADQATGAIGQVSRDANTQLTALQRLAGGLQQSAEAITLVAGSTHSAGDRARQISDLVDRGGVEMAGLVAAVNAIAKSSANVSKFVDDIARIASQTNLLSLNAEIEAARAGEHGKGFTVVAEEVGKLADSSASLATEIAAQIRDAIQQAEHGVASALLVSDSIRLIAASVAESDRMARSIATAMEQQKANVTEINGKMGELTGIAEANASAASEITSTMRDLSRLAEDTRNKVARFKTTGSTTSAS